MQPLAQDIPSAESLDLTSRAFAVESDPPLPSSCLTETRIERDEWMLMPRAQPVASASSTTASLPNHEDGQDLKRSGGDFFSSIGTERKRKERPERPDPDKVCLVPPYPTYFVTLSFRSSTSAPGKSIHTSWRANHLRNMHLQNPGLLHREDQDPNGV